VARNVLTAEVKYFLSNRVPGEIHPVTGPCITLRFLLRVAFGRWSIESCFREGKEELGLDHYEVRGWRCVHRHFFVTQLSHLFCARVRQEYDDAAGDRVDRLSVEQVRGATNAWLSAAGLPRSARRQRFTHIGTEGPSSTSSSTVSAETSRLASRIRRRESSDGLPSASTSTRSNPASPTRIHHDAPCFRFKTYDKPLAPSGAVQLRTKVPVRAR
jgi:hypothetical protein